MGYSRITEEVAYFHPCEVTLSELYRFTKEQMPGYAEHKQKLIDEGWLDKNGMVIAKFKVSCMWLAASRGIRWSAVLS